MRKPFLASEEELEAKRAKQSRYLRASTLSGLIFLYILLCDLAIIGIGRTAFAFFTFFVLCIISMIMNWINVRYYDLRILLLKDKRRTK